MPAYRIHTGRGSRPSPSSSHVPVPVPGTHRTLSTAQPKVALLRFWCTTKLLLATCTKTFFRGLDWHFSTSKASLNRTEVRSFCGWMLNCCHCSLKNMTCSSCTSPVASISREARKSIRSVAVINAVVVGGCVLLAPVNGVSAFSSPIFPTILKKTPSKTAGVEIELPNFEELFERIRQVSPLARLAIDRKDGGFEKIDEKENSSLRWRTVDANRRKTVHRIDKIDNFQNLGSPIIRFRSSLKGPCLPERFANFIMNLDERKKWDMQIADVQELYPIHDLDAANIAIGHKYGDCSHLGVGYCQTTANLVASSREQLTLCGIQDFVDGSCIIWGTELEDRHNHLLPPGERHTRARSHLFSTALMPTGPDSFDVEYILQMDIGGKIPTFLTTPVIIETVKMLFNHAKKYFAGGEGSEIANFLTEYQQMAEDRCLFSERKSILLAP